MVDRIEALEPDWMHAMHGGSLTREAIPRYTRALRERPFAYDGRLSGPDVVPAPDAVPGLGAPAGAVLNPQRAGERPVAAHLPTRAPFAAGALLAFLARRAVAGVEEVREGAYRRSLRLAHGAGTAELWAAASGVDARFTLDDPRDLDEAVEHVRALFDLDADPAAALEALGRDELIGPLVHAAPGRRVAGHVDPHELAVRAVLGQQVSVAAAATLAARLVTSHGERLDRPLGAVTHLFPAVETLAALSPESLPMPRSRARALVALTGALASGDLVLRRGADPGEARRGLLALPGIGPWTASYVALRGLGDRDAFPAGDLGIRRALERLGWRADPAGAERLAERWRPQRADAAEHLWASVADP